MTKTTVWTWIVRNAVGRGKHKTRWKLTEEDASATFGERLLERIEVTREERQAGSSEIRAGYMSKARRPGESFPKTES